MKEKNDYPEFCPVATDLREALASWDLLDPDDIKELVEYAAGTLERQHEFLKFINTAIKGGLMAGNA